MKTKFNFLVISSSLLLSAPALLAQTIITNTIYIDTNAVPMAQTVRYQQAVASDRSLGEHALLPPGLKVKMRLTDEQQTELKPIEDDFANTSRQYQTANQPRIDAAEEAGRQAREAKNDEQIQAAREQLQAVWAGLKPDRDAAIRQIEPLLTPDQVTILEDPENQWNEDHLYEANDPSAN